MWVSRAVSLNGIGKTIIRGKSTTSYSEPDMYKSRFTVKMYKGIEVIQREERKNKYLYKQIGRK